MLPFAVGGIFGFLIGFLLDKYIKIFEELKCTNSALQLEIKEKTISEAKYAALFEKNHTVTLLINPSTGSIVDANITACAFYGHPIEKIRKMFISDINVLSQEEISNEMDRAVQEGRQQYYFKHRLQSGEVRDVEVYSGPIIINGSSLLLSIINDITQLKLLRGIIPICLHCKQIRDARGSGASLSCTLPTTQKLISAMVYVRIVLKNFTRTFLTKSNNYNRPIIQRNIATDPVASFKTIKMCSATAS